MPLPPNTLLGRYEIRSQIGAGGMGEVYLAQDTKLERTVALKVLHADVAQDQQRMRRFMQEARAASALNHPYILTIHEIGEEGGVRFIATEFIQGETLRQHIRRAKTPLDEILNIAIQIADALSAAHAAKIIHRDIKPENVMVRADGYVKVLDFGLAKLVEHEASSDTEAPTRALVHTEPGMVMGTALYMSPEQARGRETDERTDTWSLGVMLYEIVAGQPPFRGETPSDIIASILKTNPTPLQMVVPEVPAELERIVMKALEKERDERYQTARDFLADLRRLKKRVDFEIELDRSQSSDIARQESAAPSPSQHSARMSDAETITDAATPTDKASQPHPTSSAEYLVTEIKRHKKGIIVALLLLLILVGGGYALYRFLAPTKTQAVHFQNVKLTRVTSEGNVGSVTISPDGKYIAYTLEEGGKRSLWTKHLATNSRVQIVAPVDAAGLDADTFSPDGSYVFYFLYNEQNPQGAIYQVPVLGGASRKVLTDIQSPMTFSSDGKQIAFGRYRPATNEYEYYVANADGTNERRLITRREPERLSLYGASWSPDGKTLAVAYGNPESTEQMTIAGVSVADGTLKPLSAKRWQYIGRVAWLGDGSGLIIVAAEQPTDTTQIWRISYPGGEAQRVTNDLNSYDEASLAPTADASAIIALQANQSSSVWIAPTNDANHARNVSTRKNTADGMAGLDWTSDGRLFYVSRVNDKVEVWLTDTNGDNPKMLMEGTSIGTVQLSPDDRHLVFGSIHSGKFQVFRAELDGSNAKQLTDHPRGINSGSITPDGRWIIYSPLGGEVWKVSIDGGVPVKLSDDLIAVQPQLSPDGKLLVFGAANEQQRPQLKVFIFNGESITPLKTFDMPVTVGDAFHWSPDGRALVFVNTTGGVSNLWQQPLDGGAPKQITDFKSEPILNFAYSRDGKQLALARGETTHDVVLISDVK